MLTRKLLALVVAVGLTFAGLSTTAEARADAFDRPAGVRAPAGSGELRVWLDLGDYEDRSPRTVTIGDSALIRRGDGVWTGVVDAPEPYLRSTMLVHVGPGTLKVWVKFKKVTP